MLLIKDYFSLSSSYLHLPDIFSSDIKHFQFIIPGVEIEL